MLSDFPLPSGAGQAEEAPGLRGFWTKLGQNKKRTIAFGLLLVVASVLLGSLSFFSASLLLFVLQMAGFFGLGYLHSLILRANVARLNSAEKMLYSLLLSGLVFLALVLLFVSKGGLPLFFVLACGCVFVLPFTVSEAAGLFDQMYTVPAATWRYSPDLSFQKSTTFLNSMPVRFRIETDALGEDGRTVAFRAPVRMKLGALFYHTTQEQNERADVNIQLVNTSDEPYEWSFSVTRLGWSRYLNPELNLIENGVKPNAVITARRLTQ